MRSVVIADDFSGAAELAGVAYQHGLSSEVQLDQLEPDDSDVIVIDANTRSLPEKEAAQVMEELANEAMKWFHREGIKDGWIYRKVDSVLRGPIAGELQAAMRGLRAPRAVLVNANPRKQRYVQAGSLWVNGQPIHETAFARDPEYPRTTMQVKSLLNWPGDDICFLAAGDRLPSTGLCVGNVASSAEMSALVDWIYESLTLSGELKMFERALKPKLNTILAGAAEFYEAILQQWFELNAIGQEPARLDPDDNVLLVSGTSMPAALASQPMTVLRASDVSAEIGKFGADHVQSLDARRMIDGFDEFIELARRSIAAHRYREIWIEGGKTASTLLRRLGWMRMRVDAVYADGVVGLNTTERALPRVVVKPGSYLWPT